jgi:hypothetical protein
MGLTIKTKAATTAMRTASHCLSTGSWTEGAVQLPVAFQPVRCLSGGVVELVKKHSLFVCSLVEKPPEAERLLQLAAKVLQWD